MKQGSCVKENSADELFGQLKVLGVRMSKDNGRILSVFFSLQTLVYARIPALEKKRRIRRGNIVKLIELRRYVGIERNRKNKVIYMVNAKNILDMGRTVYCYG